MLTMSYVVVFIMHLVMVMNFGYVYSETMSLMQFKVHNMIIDNGFGLHKVMGVFH